jgi:hypothetical protein
MSQFQNEVGLETIDVVKTAEIRDPNEMELEQLVFLTLTERLKQLQTQSQDEFKELKKRQEEVVQMHKALKAINSFTDSDSLLSFDQDSDIHQQFKDLREKFDIPLHDGSVDKNGKISYTREQRERLIENIRMSIDDHNTKNEMQMQTVTRLVNERYESYQMARAILKPIHDDKMSKARAIAGR